MKFLDGTLTELYQVNCCFVDIKDVAKAHVRAMTRPQCANRRYVLSNEEGIWWRQISEELKEGLAEQGREGYPIPEKMSAFCMLKFFSYFSNKAADQAALFGR